ncbi:MAG: iron-sulfur cluster assembly accessory protein, partial [Pseudomonadota bacterium]|nr:iron-sulfur cluster assembly accessory protein [Pseudomonadota bacterium]
EQIKVAAEQGGMQGLSLRVAAKRMGDGGVDYAMGFDETQEPDTVMEQHGVTLLISPTSYDLLDRATLDYVEIEKGSFEFVFLNPNDPNFVAPNEE